MEEIHEYSDSARMQFEAIKKKAAAEREALKNPVTQWRVHWIHKSYCHDTPKTECFYNEAEAEAFCAEKNKKRCCLLDAPIERDCCAYITKHPVEMPDDVNPTFLTMWKD